VNKKKPGKPSSSRRYQFALSKEALMRIREFLQDPKVKHARMVWSPAELMNSGCPCLCSYDSIKLMAAARFLPMRLRGEQASVAMEIVLLERLDGKLLDMITLPHPEGGTITNFAIRAEAGEGGHAVTLDTPVT
jgi:hypothetical protein